ncbi:RNA polymerase subunit sigma-70 [Kitasatospora sp. NA04385]|uniref:RNA polymerase subunit sigma-70 n=1 Tax=Kitasatospora sp. NA04385 TaxID=2742135 RepID=UPI001592A8BB|nr:RNA polymerase subunit sigma-70 [Kitasatospora sp. NA04385]QKW23770.1 RNA polymerase subunit sigma-70 [Kitasatospora sp. NA04385]
MGAVELDAHRPELTAYCYRMTGSFHDAEDLVQETLLRAWNARDRYDPARASVRTWLYRIATNACLTALEGRTRRPLPAGLGAPSRDTGAPLAPAVDVPWLEPFPDARLDVAARAELRLAWVAAVQLLPARQRAVLVLREVLAFSAAEVADQLDTTVPAVNSALQRARAALGAADAERVREQDGPGQRAVVDRYLAAFEAADVPALVGLLAEDAILEMPPLPLWYRGPEHYGRFMDRVYAMYGAGPDGPGQGGPGRGGFGWRTRAVGANGQGAFAAYAPVPDGGGHRLHSVQLLEIAGGLVTRNTVYTDPGVLALFDLPPRL